MTEPASTAPAHVTEFGLLIDNRYETVPAATEPQAREALENARDRGARQVVLVERRRCTYTHTTITAVPERMGELDLAERRLYELERRAERIRNLHLPDAGGCRSCSQPWPCQTRMLLDEPYPE